MKRYVWMMAVAMMLAICGQGQAEISTPQAVHASSLNGTSDLSSSVPPGVAPLDPPAYISAVQVTRTNARVRVSWSAVVEATGYDVWRNSGGSANSTYSCIVSNWAPTNCYDDNCINGTYYYYVKSRDALGVSVGQSPSVSVTVTILGAVIGPSTNIDATVAGEAITLQGGNSSGATAYYWREMLDNPVIGLIETPNSSTITVRPWWPGIYHFELVVASADGVLSAPASARIRVPGLSGKVYVSQSNKKLRIVGASATVDGQSVAATSDDDGEFMLLAKNSWGTVTLRMNADGYQEYAQSIGASYLYTSRPWAIDLLAESGNQWQGKIVDAVSQVGIVDAKVDVASGSGFTTLTQGGLDSSRGEFTIESPPPGSHDVVISKYGYETRVFNIRFPDVNHRTIELTPLSSASTGQIFGHIYAKGTFIPIPGISVVLEGVTGFNNEPLLAVSDSTGYYQILGVPAGQYRLVASVDYDQAADMAYRPTETTLSVSYGQATGKNLEMEGGVYAIFGDLKDTDGRAITNSLVLYSGRGANAALSVPRAMLRSDKNPISRDRTICATATPDGSGYYGIQIPSGIRMVQFSAPGYRTETLELTLANHFRQNITLTAGTNVAPPVGVSATDGDYSDRIMVTWRAATGATAYEVWRGLSESVVTAAKIGETTGGSYEDLTASGCVIYYYWIKAKNTVFESVLSSPDSGYCTTGGGGPDVKVNYMDNTMVIGAGQMATVTVAMNAGPYAGYACDWWLAVVTPAGLYYMNSASQWVPVSDVLHPAFQGPLGDLPVTTVLNLALPQGSFKFYFGVDWIMNGQLDMGASWIDSVLVIAE